MKPCVLYVFLFIVSYHRLIHADVFSAIYKIKELTEVENSLLTSLQTYIEARDKAEKPVQDNIKTFLNKTRDYNQFLTNNTTYPEHPVNAYRMIKRIHNSWEELMEEVNCPDCESDNNTEVFVTKFKKIQESLWPTEKDIKGAALAIFRIINLYRLNITELMLGNIRNYTTSPMTTKEVFQISHVASDENMIYDEIVWLQALYKLFKENRIEKGVYSLEHIDRALASAYSRYGMPWESLKYIQECIETKPDNKGCLRDKSYYEMKVKDIPVASREKKLEKENKTEDKIKYEALCRGDKLLSDAAVARQKCFFRAMSVPYERAKEEVFSLNPRIAMYHDIITSSEIKHIQEQSRKKLFRSKVISGDNNQLNSEWMHRVSQSAWLWDSDSVIRKLTKRIEKITGLDTQLKVYATCAEPFQVLNYGIGGMYEPHVDYVGTAKLPDEMNPDYLHDAGDRLATWLIYLTDVPLGGATVFPKLNIRVPVIKGSAAFWYNYNRKHFRDPRTEHAGCPVVIGSKWVSNKWFRENGQTFRRMCGLTKKEIDS